MLMYEAFAVPYLYGAHLLPPHFRRNPDKAKREAAREASRQQQQSGKKSVPKLPEETIDALNEHWENTEVTSALYNVIAENDFDSLRELLSQMPEAAHVRSEDGRGPMFWAHEKGRTKMVKAFRKLGVRENVMDSNGRTPLELSTIVVEE